MVQNASDRVSVSRQEVSFGAPGTTLGQFSHFSLHPAASLTAPATNCLALPSVATWHVNCCCPPFNKQRKVRNVHEITTSIFRSSLFSLCIMLPAERFLGSGQQTKETEIEADFSWQAATILRPEMTKGLGEEDTGHLPLSALLQHKQL